MLSAVHGIHPLSLVGLEDLKTWKSSPVASQLVPDLCPNTLKDKAPAESAADQLGQNSEPVVWQRCPVQLTTMGLEVLRRLSGCV